jgi:glycosyltransferase involved in cell wall biosynthesis
MKILIINWQDIKNPFGGGAEVHLHEIFKRISAMGHEITLLCCEFEGCKKEEIIDGIKVIRHGSRSLFNFGVKKYYRRHFEGQDFDIVIDDINKIPFYTPLYVKKPILAISHHFFGKSIFRETNPIAGLYVFLAEKLMDFVYKKTKFVVVSQSTLDEFISRGYNPANFEIVYNAITQENMPMKVGVKKQNPVITYFGRLKKYKSPDHLFKAFSIIRDVLRDAELYVIGRGDFRPELEELAERLKISSAVKFFGFVSEEEKIELLSKSWCVVNTSMKEGWGITNIEANACGTPVISADSPGLRDSVKPGLSGELYKYGDIEDLSQKIIEVIGKDSIRERYSRGAVEWANQFSWDKSAEKMLDIIKKQITA